MGHKQYSSSFNHDHPRTEFRNIGRAIQRVPVSGKKDNPLGQGERQMLVTYGWKYVQTTTTYQVAQPWPTIDQAPRKCHQTRLTASDALYNTPIWLSMLSMSSLITLPRCVRIIRDRTHGRGNNLSLRDITSSNASFILAFRFFFTTERQR